MYGEAEAATWNALTARAQPLVVSGATTTPTAFAHDSFVDFNALAIAEWLGALDVDSLMSVPAPSPLPTATTVSWWRRTSPIPEPDEDVSAYLHGVGRWSPSVSVAWRCDVGPANADSADAVNDAMTAVPLDSAELVEVPMWALHGLLAGEPTSGVLSDIDLPVADEAIVRDSTDVWVRRDDQWVALRPSRLRPGDLVLLPADVGGHDRFGWSGDQHSTVLDVGGLVSTDTLRVRLTKEFLVQLLGAGAADRASFLLQSDDPRGDLADLLDTTQIDDPVRAHLVERIKRGLPGALRQIRRRDDEGVPLAGDLVASDRQTPLDAMADSDDSTSLRTGARAAAVTLHNHLTDVGERARAQADGLGMSNDVVRSVELAGRFHDLGKAEVRFQTMLHLGNRFRAEVGRMDASRALAKSAPHDRSTARIVARRSGWPQGMRHEAVSLALVQSAPDELFAGADRSLVEHLVASHHGLARPFFPPLIDYAPTEAEVVFDGHRFTAKLRSEVAGLDHAAIFEQACERYGTWGVALLEALVRLSDISISEEGR